MSGGFLAAHSPAPSIATNASTITPSQLPRQRTHPLRVGSMKERALISHVDGLIRRINRRHAKKFSRNIDDHTEGSSGGDGGQDGEEGQHSGYEGFGEVVRDLERVIDVVWVSGTPSLQIPYLISVAGLVNTYLADYPFAPKSTFRLLRKLDSVFISLLTGEDAESGQPLSGFETKRDVVSMTEKVRIKSIAEACRVAVVEVKSGNEVDSENDEEEDMDDDDIDIDGFGEPAGQWEMETARIYEKTIQYLGDELGREAELVI